MANLVKTITAVDIGTVDSDQLLRDLTSLSMPFLDSYLDHYDPQCSSDSGRKRTLALFQGFKKATGNTM